MGRVRKPTVIDLFSGCGGLSFGLYKAGWQGLFAIEKSPDAFKTLKYNLIDKLEKPHFNWPSWLPLQNWEINSFIEQYRDRLKELQGKVDLVAGGPPCQGFSMAGRRREADVRNQLVHSYIEFISLVKPKMIFFENVKGFTQEFKKNKEKGIAYSKLVLSALNKLGYETEAQLVNFGDYGIPQKRTRFILVGMSRDYFGQGTMLARLFFEDLKKNRFDFLKMKGLTISTTLEDAISDLLQENGTVKDQEFKTFRFGVYKNTGLTSYQQMMRKDLKEEMAHPDSHRFANHAPSTVERFQLLLNLSAAKRCLDIGDEIKERLHIKKHTIIPLAPDQKAPTITTLPDDFIHYCEPRILTVREYARIQSFPDDYAFKGKYTTGGDLRTKETPRYTQIGNAIPPLFGEQAGVALNLLLQKYGRAGI